MLIAIGQYFFANIGLQRLYICLASLFDKINLRKKHPLKTYEKNFTLRKFTNFQTEI